MARSRVASSRPPHHANNSATSFINPWPSAALPTWTEIFQSSFPFGWYDKTRLHGHHRARGVEVRQPDWGATAFKSKSVNKAQTIVGTWLGHAMEGKRVYFLFDPIFSARDGPNQYQGVSRFKGAPCQVANLPGCDAVLISHNHYDHLDVQSLKAIFRQFPRAKYFVPLGIKQWLLAAINVPKDYIIELDWWQHREVGLTDFASPTFHDLVKDLQQQDAKFKVCCVPAQHNSGCSPTDQGSTLWCSWVIERFDRESLDWRGAFYHAGDTGYRRHASQCSPTCPIFKDIGDRFGPMDLSFLPIWRGGSLSFFSYTGLRLSHHDIPAALHASPTDAADMHLEINSPNTIGIHFGTLVGSENETVEAVVEFADACEARAIHGLQDGDPQEKRSKGRAGVVDMGESFIVERV